MATKVYNNKTVLEASKERISLTFDNFEKIYISFSGGKDSSVMTHLVLAEAKKRNRKVCKKEQAERLLDRIKDPLKQWKTSPIDQQAQKKWLAYSKARDAMLKKTNNSDAPWTVIRANDKKIAHINLIQHLLTTLSYPNKNKKILKFDPQIVVQWPSSATKLPWLEP